MPLQKAMHFFRQFSSNPFGGGNLIDARFAQAIDRAKLPKQKIFPVLTHARAIIENAFVDSLLQQQLMISVREPMRFIANSLQADATRRNRQAIAAASPALADKFPHALSPDR